MSPGIVRRMGNRLEDGAEVLPIQVFTLIHGWQMPCTRIFDGGLLCSGTMFLHAISGALGPHRNVLGIVALDGRLMPATESIHHHQWMCNSCGHWERANMTPQ